MVDVAPLVEKIFLGLGGGGEIKLRDDGDRLAVKLLGEGAIDIEGPQPRLHVPHRDLQIEAGQGGNKGGGGIAVDQHNVRLDLLQHALDPLQNVGGNIKKGLLILHNGKIVVRLHLEGLQHLLQHLAVLTGDANHRF